MTTHSDTVCIEFESKWLRVCVIDIDRSTLTLELTETTQLDLDEVLSLPRPFRSEVDSKRLSLVIGSLLSHDFLLSKRLWSGQSLKFNISATVSNRFGRLEALVSLNQEAALSAKPSEKILPWILPMAGTDSLYPFQREGVDWLHSSPSRLLADDMGLGKTVQTIFGVRHGFSEHLFQNVLVLCPKSLVLNWLAEFRKWAPELLALALSPPTKVADQVWDKALDNSHVVIANYEQIREAKKLVHGRRFDLVVADEAHRLRNATSQIVQGFKYVERDRFWALTGTPIERDLRDLATLMSLLDEKRFSVSDGKHASAALREKAKPYILRRTKESVLKELPDLVSGVETLELLETQMQTYRRVQAGTACNGETLKNALHKLGELRRVCDYDPISKSSAKLNRIAEELLEVKNANEKAIVFSFVIEPLEALQVMTEKLLGAVMIHGQLDGDERNQVIKRFKTDPGITALFASSKVASEGLTLVEANHVFFINRWWNPSSNAQARDRVNRIGQQRCVFIHEYVCIGTVEESIQRLLKAKGDVYDNVIGRLEDELLKEPEIKAHIDGKQIHTS